VLALVFTPAWAQAPEKPAAPRVSVPAADQPPPSPERLRACRAQGAAKRDAEVHDAFIKFCLTYDGSAASSVSAWNNLMLKK